MVAAHGLLPASNSTLQVIHQNTARLQQGGRACTSTLKKPGLMSPVSAAHLGPSHWAQSSPLLEAQSLLTQLAKQYSAALSDCLHRTPSLES